MRDITLDDWQAVLDEDEDTGKSQSTINNDAALMRVLCSYAMEQDIIWKDYSQYLNIHSVGAKRSRDALNDILFAKLSQMAAGVPWADTALMQCYTGFRVSEFLQLTRFVYHAEHGGYLQGGLKTDAKESDCSCTSEHPALSASVAGKRRGYYYLRKGREIYLVPTV